jgi:hypothetical protein
MTTRAEKILSLLDEVYTKRRLDEMALPQVGVFYVIDGELRSYTEEARTAPLDNQGIRYTKYKHEDYWKVVKSVLDRIDPGPETDWQFFPRGRIYYDEEKRKFHIVADQCVMSDDAVVNKIISEFNLPREKAKIKKETDRHYRCFQCKPMR